MPEFTRGSTPRSRDLLADASAGRHHEFWPCDVALLDAGTVDPSQLHGARRVTDAYLLALAVVHGGRFATFDQPLSLSAVPRAGDEHLAVL
jgi:predicted nucleic acid-binding protein